MCLLPSLDKLRHDLLIIADNVEQGNMPLAVKQAAGERPCDPAGLIGNNHWRVLHRQFGRDCAGTGKRKVCCRHRIVTHARITGNDRPIAETRKSLREL